MASSETRKPRLWGLSALHKSTTTAGATETVETTSEKHIDGSVADSNELPASSHTDSNKQLDSVAEKAAARVETDHVGSDKAKEEEEEEDTSSHLHGVALLVVVISLCLTTFLIGLDQMIIATAIPKITAQFKSLDDVGWYGSAYLLTTTSLQPSFGKIYTYFNVKWTFVIAMAVFEIGSIICAVAQNSPTLIVGRAVAGSGAAGLFSGGMTIVGYSVPLRKRAIYIACLSSMFGISSIIGPILGGAFTDHLSWRWCFWINLPFGFTAIAVVMLFFRSPTRSFTGVPFKQKVKEMDLPGAFFLISAIVCLLLALQWGGVTYPWSNSRVWGCLLGFGLLLLIFIGLQLRAGPSATIPPNILSNRTIAAAALTLAFISMGIYTHIYYLPFYFQTVKGTSAEQSGIRCIAYLVTNTIFSIIYGGLVTVVGYYTPFIYLGTALFTIGSGMLHTLTAESSTAQWLGYQILAGAGSGTVQLPFIAVQVVLSAKDMPTGNAIAIFFNSLGGALAISIAQNIFANRFVEELRVNFPGQDVSALLQAGGSMQAQAAAIDDSMRPGLTASYQAAVAAAFILPVATGGLAFVSSLLFEWKSVKGKKLMGGGGGG